MKKNLDELKKDKNYIVQGNVVRKRKIKVARVPEKQTEVPEQQNKSERIKQELVNRAAIRVELAHDRELISALVIKVNDNDVRITRIERLWLFRALVWLKLIRK